MTDDSGIQQFLELIQQACARDAALREKFGTESKFKFIQDQLNTCLKKLEADLEAWQKTQVPDAKKELFEHETVVYVHLFNAQGLSLPTWLPMLSEGVLYEYSINRPIYTEEEHIKQYIRLRPNPVLHGYFSIVIDKSTIKPKSDTHLDSLGQPLIKVKEGSLRRDQLQHFFHAGAEFEIVNNEFKKVK